jgi:hypothetical protein
MRLTDKFRWITEQLNDLYQYRSFLEERIVTLEAELEDVASLMEFADTLNDSSFHGQDNPESE